MKSGSSVPPARLLTDEQAADFCGVSKTYLRGLVERGVLKRVSLPTTDGGPGRARLLRIDVKDLDPMDRWAHS